MMLVWVVLVFCQVAQPTFCQERLLDEPQPLGYAMVAAEEEAAEWVADHPSWYFDRARLTIGEHPPTLRSNEI
jgi:hypothetical protein